MQTLHNLNPKEYKNKLQTALSSVRQKQYMLAEGKNPRLFSVPFNDLSDAEKKIIFNNPQLQSEITEYNSLNKQITDLESLHSQWSKLDWTDHLELAKQQVIAWADAAKDAVASSAISLWAAAVANAGAAGLSNNQALKSLADITDKVASQQSQIESQAQTQLAWINTNAAQIWAQRTAQMTQQLLAEKQAKDQINYQKELMEFQYNLNNRNTSSWLVNSYPSTSASRATASTQAFKKAVEESRKKKSNTTTNTPSQLPQLDYKWNLYKSDPISRNIWYYQNPSWK